MPVNDNSKSRPSPPSLHQGFVDIILEIWAYELLLSSISDPHNPTHCGMCIDGALIECTKLERESSSNSPAPSKSPRFDPVLWNTVVAFMFVKRTDQEMERLLNRLSQCDCLTNENTPIIQHVHDSAEDNSEMKGYTLRMVRTSNKESHGVLKPSTIARSTWAIDIFQTLSITVRQSSLKAAAKSESNSWPISLTDIIPFGADNFVQCLLQWHRFLQDPVIFGLMGMVLRTCQMLVIPSVIKHSFTETVVGCTRETADRTMAYISRLKANAEIKPSLGEANDIAVCFSKLNAYMSGALGDIPNSRKVALFRGLETRTIQLHSIMIYILLEWESIFGFNFHIKENLAIYGEELFHLFRMHQAPPMPIHPFIYEHNAFSARAFWNYKRLARQQTHVMMAILDLRRDTRCSAIGCHKTLHTEGRSFQRCSGCSIVTYCSRKCQSKAWKTEKYPHRDVCPALQTLIKKAGGLTLFSMNHPMTFQCQERLVLNTLTGWEGSSLASELQLVDEWARKLEETREQGIPNITEWSAGYEDYDEVITQISGYKTGVKPMYMQAVPEY